MHSPAPFLAVVLTCSRDRRLVPRLRCPAQSQRPDPRNFLVELHARLTLNGCGLNTASYLLGSLPFFWFVHSSAVPLSLSLCVVSKVTRTSFCGTNHDDSRRWQTPGQGQECRAWHARKICKENEHRLQEGQVEQKCACVGARAIFRPQGRQARGSQAHRGSREAGDDRTTTIYTRHVSGDVRSFLLDMAC